MGFLPSDYQPPSTGHYLKLQQGENRIRPLDAAIVGNLYWHTDNDGSRHPVRKRLNEPVDRSELGVDQYGKPERVKQFVAFPAWNYSAEQVEIVELTQTTILRALQDLDESPNWGDCRNYDIVIKKSGSGLDTTYSVLPQPPQPLPDEIRNEFEAANVNMQALFNGDDPFGGGNGNGQSDTPAQQSQAAPEHNPAPVAGHNGDLKEARNAAFGAFLELMGGDRDAAKAEAQKVRKDMFPDKEATDMTADDYYRMRAYAEAENVPF